VEMVGTNSFSFTLGFRAYPSDWDGDGLPNALEDQYGFLNATNAADGVGDQDGDKVPDAEEWIANTDLNNGLDFLHAVSSSLTNSSGVVVRFPSKSLREYHIFYANSGPLGAAWIPATTNALPGTGGILEWLDNGVLTAPTPALSTNRTYQIRVQLPQ